MQTIRRRFKHSISRCVAAATIVLPYVNTGTLAVILFIATALQNAAQGMDAETGRKATVNAQGYLKVYSATDETNEGNSWYFPHSAYTIYAACGNVLRNVENHNSRTDESPQIITLPVGRYTIQARSERHGYVRVPILISEARQTVLHLDFWEDKVLTQVVRN